ncbi:MAG: 6-carboxytetrahydropterin synthase [Acidobacteriaceae bacterium]|nr:6-carboxytetrahydropterin synthase [Acidobacteriaceae bacterium]MBV8569208.1 6-carboxytetrahydropterin synthase [Acidobacteriaceae bacterium]
MFVTRRAEFSASHVCRIPSLDDSTNRELFDEEANPNGHGHNYIVEITVEGEPDPLTGMVIDLKDLKGVLESEVVLPMDHRFLNYEVAPFDRVVPTTPNVAREIWRRLEPVLAARQAALARVRLFESPDLYVDVLRDGSAAG